MAHEYTNQVNGSAGCGDYSNLASYNVDRTSSMYGMPQYSSGPYNPGVPSMAVQVIPQFSSPGYNALQHGVKGQACGGYFKVKSAYPGAGSGNCTQFATRSCNN